MTSMRGEINDSEARHSVARRVLRGAASTVVIGGTLFMGGIATLVVASAHHITSTTPLTSGSTVGSALLKDSATLGATTTDRKVEFFLWAPGTTDCKGTPVFTDTEPVTTANQGNGVTPVITQHSYTAVKVGTYQWTAVILDPQNHVEWPSPGMADQCGLEPAVITAASPAINTTPGAGGPVGTVVSDTATVSGGFSPTGTVTFRLFPPADASCNGTPVYTSTPPVALSAGKASSGTYASIAVGTYRWVATYNGDANNKPVTSGCSAEQVVITKAQPAINTTPSAGGVTGTAISDSATVSGGSAPTGTVTFNLYGPTDTSCAGTPVFTSTIPLATATVGSGSFSGTSTAGTYSWTAAYSGDSKNLPASSPCTAETVVITSPPPGGNGGVLAASITTPDTGGSIPMANLAIGGLLLVSGAGVAMLGVIAPRRRRG